MPLRCHTVEDSGFAIVKRGYHFSKTQVDKRSFTSNCGDNDRLLLAFVENKQKGKREQRKTWQNILYGYMWGRHLKWLWDLFQKWSRLILIIRQRMINSLQTPDNYGSRKWDGRRRRWGVGSRLNHEKKSKKIYPFFLSTVCLW